VCPSGHRTIYFRLGEASDHHLKMAKISRLLNVLLLVQICTVTKITCSRVHNLPDPVHFPMDSFPGPNGSTVPRCAIASVSR